MRVALFVPCYVDQFYPKVAISTLELLEKLGVEVSFPSRQTCCGQPMANSGFEHLTGSTNQLFVEQFAGFDYIVSPSGSCVLHIKDHLHVDGADVKCGKIQNSIYELTEFLTDILKVNSLPATFPYKVGVHQSCHGQRGLNLSQMSELVKPPFSKTMQLLDLVRDLTIIDLQRKDECCGFGGTFCVSEEAVSVKMGKDRIADHIQNGAEYITGSDMSCLMHLEGILRRQNSKTKVVHIAEILNSQ
jgi:L-lactate dehydrogenase complex protein LldE